jgi:hypothetical protein
MTPGLCFIRAQCCSKCPILPGATCPQFLHQGNASLPGDLWPAKRQNIRLTRDSNFRVNTDTRCRFLKSLWIKFIRKYLQRKVFEVAKTKHIQPLYSEKD